MVIVNWNGLSHLAPCLESLRSCGHRLEIIVVDNRSTDGSVEWLSTQPEVRLIQQEVNLGYAAANNLGIEAAAGNLILLLNNDTLVTPGFLQPHLEAFAADPTLGATQSKLITFAEPARIDGVGSYLTWTGFLYHLHYGHLDQPGNAAFDIFCAKGAAMVIRRDVLRKTGGFDADFFAYLEDSDLSWRIWLGGWRIQCLPESVVRHRGAATASRLDLEFVLFHSYKNRIAMLIKNLSAYRMLSILPVHILINLVLAGLFLARGQTAGARAIAAAMTWNLSNIRLTLAKRRRVQTEVRRVSDSVLWPAAVRHVKPSFFYYMLVGFERYEDD